MNITEHLSQLLNSESYEIIEKISIAAKKERLQELPKSYQIDSLINLLPSQTNYNVWEHQSYALSLLESKNNVVVSTGTASGKSLIFQLAVAKDMIESTI